MAATREYVFIVKFEGNNVGGLGPLLEGNVDQPPTSTFLQKVSALFAGIAGGNNPARVLFAPTAVSGGTASSGTITCTQASVSAGDTITVGAQVFTAKSSGAKYFENEFNIGATDNECAANVARAIGANPHVTATVAVSVATNVVTLTSHFASSYADQLSLAETGTGFVVSGATLGSGANQTQTDDVQGYPGGGG